MSDIYKPTNVYTWLAADVDAFCLPQVDGLNGILTLNGTLVPIGIQNPTASLIDLGVARTVSITSAADASGDSFLISGTLNGWPVSQTIAGPHNDTVYTTQIFDTVSQVKIVDGIGGNLVSVGTGLTGRTSWFTCETKAQNQVVTAQVQVTSAAINWQPQVSLLRVTGPIDPPSQIIAASTVSNTSGFGFSFQQNITIFAIFVVNAGPAGDPPTNASGALNAYILGQPTF